MADSLGKLRDSVLGFSGLGGLSWALSVLGSGGGDAPEDYTLADLRPPEARAVLIDGWPVALYEAGQGDTTLVFIHGFGMGLQTWRPVQAALAQHYRTVALDLWGFGASARPERAQPLDWARQITGVLDALDIPQAVLVGHSLGGRASLLTAAHHPERVQRLVLCDADFGQAPQGYLAVYLLAHSPLLPLMMKRLRAHPDKLRKMMEQVCLPGPPVTDEFFERHYRPLRAIGHARTWRSLARAHPWRDVRHLPERVRCPALVLWGAQDSIVPLAYGQALARRLSDSRLQVLPETGHFPHEEQPEAVIASIESFLTDFMAKSTV